MIQNFKDRVENKSIRYYRHWLIGGTIIAWFAVLLQAYLAYRHIQGSRSLTILRFFSFFTIQSNILVGIYFLARWKWPGSGIGRFFSKPGNATAIAIYITVVGIVYNLILRALWSPHGWQQLADEILHVVVPILFFLFWFIFVPKDSLRWKNSLPWLIYPLCYLIYILIKGIVSMEYPYPFLDVNALGYERVFVNAGAVCLGFQTVSLLYIAIAKWTTKRSGHTVSL